MSISEQAFIVVLILNTLVAVIYGIWNFIQCRIREKSVKEYMIRMVIMLMCPVVGPMFFAVIKLIGVLFFRQNVDLADVIFSKERVTTYLHADEEQVHDNKQFLCVGTEIIQYITKNGCCIMGSL